MEKSKQVFVGGYCGSGTRVIQDLLHKSGFFIGDPICPTTYDYFPITCIKNNLVLGHGISEMDMKEVLQKLFGCWWGQHDKWSIKHPFLMVCGNYLKRIFPDSKIIIIVRHGIDNILNNHTMEGDIGSILMPSILKEETDILLRKMKFWNFAYKLAVHDSYFSPNDFLIIKLENLVFDQQKEIEKINSFLDIEINESALKEIRQPKSIGRRHKINTLIDGNEYVVYYPKKDLNRLYKEGKEMLEYFEYGK